MANKRMLKKYPSVLRLLENSFVIYQDNFKSLMLLSLMCVLPFLSFVMILLTFLNPPLIFVFTDLGWTEAGYMAVFFFFVSAVVYYYYYMTLYVAKEVFNKFALKSNTTMQIKELWTENKPYDTGVLLICLLCFLASFWLVGITFLLFTVLATYLFGVWRFSKTRMGTAFYREISQLEKGVPVDIFQRNFVGFLVIFAVIMLAESWVSMTFYSWLIPWASIIILGVTLPFFAVYFGEVYRSLKAAQ